MKIRGLALFVFLLSILVTGCVSPTRNGLSERIEPTTTTLKSGSNSPLVIKTETEKLTNSAVGTAIPTQRLKPSSTSTIGLGKTGIKRQCLDILSELPEYSHPVGSLILEAEWAGETSYQYDFSTRQRQVLPTSARYFSTSPNGEWIFFENKKDGNDQLVFMSADKKIEKHFPKQDNWYLELGTWLNNERFMFNVLTQPNIVPPVHIIDLSRNEQIQLNSDYPGLVPSILGPRTGANFQFVYSSVLYDPSTKYVLYPKTDGRRLMVELRERKQGKSLGELEDLNYFNHNPLWSLDGQYAYMAVAKQWDSEKDDLVDEWFQISPAGEIKRLTCFEYSFTNARIGTARLSPDSGYLAFWISTQKGVDELAVMDLASFKVTNYCLPGEINRYGDRPVWSPDSRYIAIGDKRSGDNESVRTILVSTFENWAALIEDHVFPAGWIVAP